MLDAHNAERSGWNAAAIATDASAEALEELRALGPHRVRRCRREKHEKTPPGALSIKA